MKRGYDPIPPELARLMKGAPPTPLPEKYRIVITVEPLDDTGASLTVTLDEMERAALLAPDYRNDGIAAMVRNLDHFVYHQGDNPTEGAQPLGAPSTSTPTPESKPPSLVNPKSTGRQL